MKTYTFHVSLPGHGRVWRKLELTGENTLEDLHFAIQDAYDFDADHLYSFFMSGKAWDPATEYSLPEDADPWEGMSVFAEEEEDEEEGEDEDTDEVEAAGEPPADLPAPTAQNLRMMHSMIKENPEARSQFVQSLTQQMGLPTLMAEAMLANLDQLMSTASDEQIDGILNSPGLLGDEEANDVRTTTLESLQLRKGKKFMYLFDYGDEWRFTVRLEAINPKGEPDVAYPRLVESVGEAPPQYPDWDEEADEDEG